MEPSYFLETASPWRCRDERSGPVSAAFASIMPHWFNASSSLSFLCNGSSEWIAAVSAAASQQNSTDEVDIELPHFNELSLVKTIVLSAMFVVAFSGNVATLMRMYRMRRRRSTINFLITHLATADLFVTFFCNVTDTVWTATVQWVAGDAACKLIKFLQVPSCIRIATNHSHGYPISRTLRYRHCSGDTFYTYTVLQQAPSYSLDDQYVQYSAKRGLQRGLRTPKVFWLGKGV